MIASRPRSTSRHAHAEQPIMIGQRRPALDTRSDHGRSLSPSSSSPLEVRRSRRPAPVIDYRLKIEPIPLPNDPPVCRNIAMSSGRSELAVAPSRLNRENLDRKRSFTQRDVQTKQSMELQEAKSRVEQLEQKIQWWADSTNTWRDKWQSARSERNDLREQNRQLRAQLGLSIPSDAAKREKTNRTKSPRRRRSRNGRDSAELVDSAVQTSNEDSTPEPTGLDFDLHSILRDLANVTIREPTKTIAVQTESPALYLSAFDAFEGRNSRNRVEELQQQLTSLRTKHQALESRDQDNALQFSLCQTELSNLRLELDNETNAKLQLERELSKLRYMVEEWQQKVASANTLQLSAEQEKQALSREIRQLRNHCDNLQNQINKFKDTRKKTLPEDANIHGTDHCQNDSELRRENLRLQKSLQDQMAELGHVIRRLEQYESEVGLLRTQITLLNQELIAARNANDDHISDVERHKLLNQDLRDQIDSMQIQIAHLQTRFRKSGSRFRSTKRGAFGEESEDDINVSI